MDRYAMAPALRGQKIDEGAIAADDAGLRTPSAIHPFVPKRQDAGSLGVGRVIALDHPLDGMPQSIVLGAGEMPSQELGDSQIVLQFLQRLVKLCLTRILRLLAREPSVFDGPLRTFDRQQRKPRLAQQAVRDGRLAMDEFGPALRRVSELSSWKGMDTPAASVSRFQFGDPLARPPELAGGHQACAPRAGTETVLCMRK